MAGDALLDEFRSLLLNVEPRYLAKLLNRNTDSPGISVENDNSQEDIFITNSFDDDVLTQIMNVLNKMYEKDRNNQLAPCLECFSDSESNIECCTSCQPSKKEWNHILLIACSEGYTQLCELIVKSGSTDLELFDEDKITNPLIAAVKSSNFYLVQLLLDNKVMINATNKLYKTALHYASESNYQEIIQYLIEKGANILASDHDGLSPLEIILKKNTNMKNEENIENLAKSSNIHFLFSSKNNLLSSAVEANNPNDFYQILELFSKYSVKINAEEICQIISKSCSKRMFDFEHFQTLFSSNTFDVSDFNKIEISAICSSIMKVENHLLLDLIIKLEYFETITKEEINTIIIDSIKEHKIKCCLVLLDNFPLQNDLDGKMVLNFACRMGKFELIKRIVEIGVNPTIYDFQSIFESCTDEFVSIVKYLLKNESLRPHISIKNLEMALLTSSEYGFFNAVHYLVSRNININCKDDNGHTPLYKAATKGHLTIVKFLVEKNADINNELMKIDLKSPLHIACQNGHGEVVDFLLHSLFTQNSKCQNVSTLLLDAVTAGQSEVVFVLLRWASNFTPNNDQNSNKKQDLPLLMDKDEIKNLKSSPSNSSEHNTDEKLCDEVNKILKGSMFAHMREKCLKYIKNDPSLLRKIKDLNILQYTAEEKLNDIKMSCLANDIAGCHVETTTDPYNDGIRQKTNSLKSQSLEKFDDNSLDISPSIYSLKEISKSAADKKKTRQNQKDKNITLKNISSHISVSGVETGDSNMNTTVFEENIKNSYLFDNHTNKAVYHSLVGEMDNPNFTSIINIDYTTSKSHDTALTIASTKGFIDIVSLLLKAGANIEHKNRRGYTSLMLAAENNHCQIIHLLLEYEADVQNETEKTHDTALGISCAAGSLDSALILLENGANINHQNHNDYTPLCFASSSGNLNIVKKLIDAGAIIDGSRDSCKSGITLLMLATMQNNIGIVKYLLEKGANVDAKIEANKATPITFASAQSFIDILNILIEYGANIEHRSKSGLTPLMEATINGNNEACNILLNAGAEVNPPCVASSKDSPLTLAATNDSLETIISLCKKGAIIEHRNKKNVTALWIAASNGFFNIVRYLHSEMHASLSQEDSRGVSTLFVAFRNGHIKVVDYLAKKLSHLPTEKDVEKFANSLKVSNKIELRNDIKSSSELENNIRLSKEIISKARDVQTKAAGKNIKQFLKSFGAEDLSKDVKNAKNKSKNKKKNSNIEVTSVVSILNSSDESMAKNLKKKQNELEKKQQVPPAQETKLSKNTRQVKIPSYDINMKKTLQINLESISNSNHSVSSSSEPKQPASINTKTCFGLNKRQNYIKINKSINNGSTQSNQHSESTTSNSCHIKDSLYSCKQTSVETRIYKSNVDYMVNQKSIGAELFGYRPDENKNIEQGTLSQGLQKLAMIGIEPNLAFKSASTYEKFSKFDSSKAKDSFKNINNSESEDSDFIEFNFNETHGSNNSIFGSSYSDDILSQIGNTFMSQEAFSHSKCKQNQINSHLNYKFDSVKQKNSRSMYHRKFCQSFENRQQTYFSDFTGPIMKIDGYVKLRPCYPNQDNRYNKGANKIDDCTCIQNRTKSSHHPNRNDTLWRYDETNDLLSNVSVFNASENLDIDENIQENCEFITGGIWLD